VRIAGASDLSAAFADVGATFIRQTGITPEFTFGSSGLIAKQISEGMGVDLFASANVKFVDDVIAAGRCSPASKYQYARGRIVVWVKNGTVTPPTSLEDLADPRFAKIAIANPEHAPYGVGARQALEKVGIWAAVEPRLVLGENVRATLQYAQTGNVEAAIVALSLSIGSEGGTALEIAPELHAPLDQALVVCGTGPGAEAGAQFAKILASSDGAATMKKYGFVLPTAAP
jgi:molybdate transport system substrate-binding protein